ncbi:MAG TPA: hypothetical protein PK095_16455 [Myxococcota bacterium]|nr:hypothetical protein [Myxococcota bacterium]
MNLKRIMLGLAALATLGSTSALAAPPDVSARQFQTKSTLNAFDLGLKGEQVTVTKAGRRDLVMVSDKAQGQLLADLKDAYRTERRLPNGYKVAGWAHLANDSHTFTLKNDAGERMIAEVSGDRGQTKVKVWGAVRPDRPKMTSRANLERRNPIR